MSETGRIQSFEKFWAFYVERARSPLNRFLHYVGTILRPRPHCNCRRNTGLVVTRFWHPYSATDMPGSVIFGSKRINLQALPIRAGPSWVISRCSHSP